MRVVSEGDADTHTTPPHLRLGNMQKPSLVNPIEPSLLKIIIVAHLLLAGHPYLYLI